MNPYTKNPREEAAYIRFFEIMSVISADWGETVKTTNDYCWKGFDLENAERALETLKRINSPMQEMMGLLEREIYINKKAHQD